MKRLTIILSMLLVMTSCVHEWPTSVPTDVTLKFVFDRTMQPYDTIEVETKTKAYEAYDARYVVEAFKVKPDGSDYYRDAAARTVYTKDDVMSLDHEVVFTVPDEGLYVIKVWTDFVDAGSLEHKYYNPDNFGEIVIHKHAGNDEFRDAYFGSQQVEVIRYGSQVPLVEGIVQMSRPNAKFEVVTTDLGEFIEKETKLLQEKLAESGNDPTKVPVSIDLDDYVVRILYNGFMPSAFNMHTGRPNDSKTGVLFESTLKKLNDDEALMGFDYVLAHEGDASVTIALGLFDKDGNELAGVDNINIPLRRNMLTTIKGSFLLQESSGGVSINPDFDGEFNLYL